MDEIHPLPYGNYPYLSFHTYTFEDEENTLFIWISIIRMENGDIKSFKEAK